MESRRSFIKTCLAAAGFLTVLPAVLSAEEKQRGPALVAHRKTKASIG